MLSFLMETGFVTATAGDPPHYLPAHEPESIAVKDVLDALKNHGDKCEITRMTDEEKHLREILARLDLCTASSLDGMTLKELVAGPPTDIR